MSKMKEGIKRVVMAASLALSTTVYAGGGGVTGGATEVTQILNNIELGAIHTEEVTQVTKLVDQINNQVTMINNQINMYTDMLMNSGALSAFNWGQAMADIGQLVSVVQKGQAIAYSMSNIDQTFKNRFKGYGDFVKGTYGTANFLTDYKSWNQTQQDGILGALMSANLQASQFATEDTTLKSLEAMSQTSQGRMQALQVGNQISMQAVRQTQKLRELVMSQMQMQGNYLAAEAAKDAARQARAEKFFNTPNGTILGNGKAYDPGTL